MDLSDAHYDQVSLLVPMNSHLGTPTWADFSKTRRALSPAGTPLFAPYYANSRKDGLWVTYFNGGSALTLPDNANVANFGTGDFTVEMRLALHDGGHGSAWPRILETNHYPNPGGWGLVGSASENPGRLRFDLSDGSPLLITQSALTNLTYYHVAITRAAGQLRLFLDGVLQGALASAHDFSANRFRMGANLNPSTGEYFKGWVRDVRITPGVARYTAAFTPPAANSFYRGPAGVSRVLPQTLASALRFAQLGEPTERTKGIQALRRVAPNPQIGRGVVVRNVALGYQAGDRTVALSGTTKVKALPANIPVSRPVRLYRNDTGALVAETQSRVDGSYTFQGLSLDQRYFVVAFDPTHVHRAVVADHLTAERIP